MGLYDEAVLCSNKLWAYARAWAYTRVGLSAGFYGIVYWDSKIAISDQYFGPKTKLGINRINTSGLPFWYS